MASKKQIKASINLIRLFEEMIEADKKNIERMEELIAIRRAKLKIQLVHEAFIAQHPTHSRPTDYLVVDDCMRALRKLSIEDLLKIIEDGRVKGQHPGIEQ